MLSLADISNEQYSSCGWGLVGISAIVPVAFGRRGMEPSCATGFAVVVMSIPRFPAIPDPVYLGGQPRTTYR
jgi:hypothetical protein